MQSESSTIRTLPRPCCILCGSEGEPLYQNLQDPFFGAKGIWAYSKCPSKTCGLIWLNPSPQPSDLHLAYLKYFTHGSADETPNTAAGLRSLLYQVYKKGAAVPLSLIGLNKVKRRMAYMFLDDLKPGTVLDVGCGDGLYLSRMRAKGWMVNGVDFDPKAIEHAKVQYGMDLHHGDLFSARFPDNSFDAITLSHVIEHVPDPIALLKEVGRIAKPGARVVLTTPNTGSFGHEKFREFWFGLDPPRHLNLYSTTSLADLAKRSGLRVVEVRSTAANADIFLGASESIQLAKSHQAQSQPAPNLGRTLRAFFGQCKEQLALRDSPERGEEAILVTTKD